MAKEIKLPSGRAIEVTLAPFEESRMLYEAILEELKLLKFDPSAPVDVNFFKDLFCSGFSSKKITAAVNACFKRVTYEKLKIGPDTFESEEGREDYYDIVFEVAKENVLPFTKNLSARWSQVLAIIPKDPA